MALNFPDNPSLNDTYVDSTSGFTYTWNGTVWISVIDRKIGNIKKIDDISASFDGSQTVFTIYSNGQVITPLETNKTIISVGGVLQNPGDDYSVFGSQITFSTAPATGLTFFGQVLQTDRPKSTLPDGTVGPEDLTTGGFSWNSSGDFIVSGILTSGTSSVTINGSTNRINVGTGVTISSGGITAGIITATTFYGSGVNLTNAGFGTQSSANTSGIITATRFSGDGRGLTDVGGYLAGLIYSPGIGQTEVATSTGIAITFTKSVQAGVGTITLRENSASGTIVESYNISSSNRITISGASLSISPTNPLGAGTTYYVVIPQGTLTDTYETGGNLGITSFTFVTASSAGPGLFAWGSNSNGVLGLNDGVNRSSPHQIPGTIWNIDTNSRLNKFSASSSPAVINTSGELWVWGDNSQGQLGQNDIVQRSSPTQVPGTQWNTISTSGTSSVSIKTDGSLWVWGYNTSPRSLGLNDAVSRSSPVQIPGTQWSNARIADNNAIFSKTDGTLWGVGAGAGIAQNNTVGYSSPRQIPGTQWNSNNFDMHFNGFLAMKTDNTLWHCGYNSNGISGQNTNLVYYSSPIQIPGTQWSSIADVGRQSVAVFKSDNTLWVWGYNDFGNLGQNNSTNGGISSPTQIPGTQWNQVTLSNSSGWYKKTDGTLYGSGDNSSGQLGINDSVRRSSPIQIPGTQWTFIPNGNESQAHLIAIKQA
jgi:alpha-tubulin suppressor-like RCC1 family protein